MQVWAGGHVEDHRAWLFLSPVLYDSQYLAGLLADTFLQVYYVKIEDIFNSFTRVTAILGVG